MKKTIVFALFIFATQFAIGQHQLHIKGGPTFSTFLFKNSESDRDESLKHINTSYFGVSYDLLFGDKHLVRPEIAYRSSGARSDLNNIPLRWELNYLDINVSYSFQLYAWEKVQLYMGLGPSMGILMGGEQQIGDRVYDVVEEESLKRIDFGFNFMGHSKFLISENLFLTLEYRYGLGVLQVESNVNQPEEQTSRNRYHAILAGLAFNL